MSDFDTVYVDHELSHHTKTVCMSFKSNITKNFLRLVLFVAFSLKSATLTEVFSALPQRPKSVLILHCTLDLADGEIGSLVGMSRSAVRRHRTKAQQELRRTDC